MSLPKDAVLTPGSRVCVTGANGLIGSYVIDQLLTLGLRARGVVRDSQKSGWLQAYFDDKYGADKFELIEVKDLGASGALEDALQGCDAVAAVASDVSFAPDPNVVVKGTIQLIKNVLDAASRNPSIKRVVYTSSAAASIQKMNEPYDLLPTAWNDKAVEDAWAPPPYTPERGVTVYCAAKVQSEQAFFKFGQEKAPHFVVNSVLPDFVVGPPLNREKQGYPSSMGLFKTLWDDTETWKFLPGQYMIDAGDTAKLHVAALTHPEVKSERVFAFGHRKLWSDWIRILKGIYPQHKFPEPPSHEDAHIPNVIARPRAEELLTWLTGTGFRPMEDSLKEACDFFQKEG